MKVEEILKVENAPLVTVKPHATISTVAHRLKNDRVGCAVISEDGKHPEGIIAVRDIVYAMADHWGSDPKDNEFSFMMQPVSDIMTHHVHVCRPKHLLKEVMAMMLHGHYLHIPVVNEANELVGIISIDDVIKFGVGELEVEAEILRERLLSHDR